MLVSLSRTHRRHQDEAKAGANLQVSTHNILKDRTLSTRLTANNDDLGKVDRVVHADGCENILELVHEPSMMDG